MAVLHFHQPDDCCSEDLARALGEGKLEAVTEWVHERCGQPWHSHKRQMGGEDVVVWLPYDLIEVFKP